MVLLLFRLFHVRAFVLLQEQDTTFAAINDSSSARKHSLSNNHSYPRSSRLADLQSVQESFCALPHQGRLSNRWLGNFSAVFDIGSVPISAPNEISHTCNEHGATEDKATSEEIMPGSRKSYYTLQFATRVYDNSWPILEQLTVFVWVSLTNPLGRFQKLSRRHEERGPPAQSRRLASPHPFRPA